MSKDLIFYLGLIAGSCTTFAFIPQVYHIWKHRSAKDLSWAMVTVFSTGALLWLCYGVQNHDAPVVAANAITLVLNLMVISLKWKFSTGIDPAGTSNTTRKVSEGEKCRKSIIRSSHNPI